MPRPLIALLSALAATSLAAQTTTPPDDNFDACTSIMVSRGASADGSVMITYSADAPFMPKLLHHLGGTHTAGEPLDLLAWENDRVRGQVLQVAQDGPSAAGPSEGNSDMPRFEGMETGAAVTGSRNAPAMPTEPGMATMAKPSKAAGSSPRSSQSGLDATTISMDASSRPGRTSVDQIARIEILMRSGDAASTT